MTINLNRTLVAVGVFILGYTALVQFQVFRQKGTFGLNPVAGDGIEPKHKVYNFSFSKFSNAGEKELEIEGDSADMLAQTVQLINVMAKTYADETPVTITSDEGYYDKAGEIVHFQKNVVATTHEGARLFTEALDVFPRGKTMKTDLVAEVRKDNISIEGEGADGDSNLKKVNFKKNVKVVVIDPDVETGQPTVITSDGPLLIDYDKNVAYFTDNVISRDARGTLKADKMNVFYDKVTRRVAKMVAMDNAVLERSNGDKTFSDHIIYLAEDGRVIIGGDSEAIHFEDEKKSSDSGFLTGGLF